MKQIQEQLDDAVYLAGHSVAGDITELVAAGLKVRESWVTGERVLDSLLLSRMRDENDLSYELENLVTSRFDLDPWKHETEPYNWVKERNEQGKMVKRRSVDARRWPPALRARRCARDAWAARLLAEADYDPKQKALIEYTQRTANVLERVNLAGAIVDMQKFDQLDADLSIQLTQARDLLTKAAAQQGVEGFSPTNDGHIRELLYKKLGLPVLSKTKGGLPSVDKQTLKQLGDHAVLKHLLDFNKLDKLYTVNVSGVRELLHCGVSLPRQGVHGTDVLHALSLPVGYLPFRINPLGARTGRRSATRPNSQNWPESVRGIVTSRFPGGMILNADYSKLEVVLIAWVAGDEKLLAAFTGGKGYIDVSRELFGRDVENGTDEYRAVKSIVLGVHYNMQTPKMARQLALLGITFSEDWNEHEKETDRLRRLYLRRYSGIGRYMEERERYWLKTGTSRSYTGRVRHLPVPGDDGKGYGHMLNQAINFPIQSLASDVTASALIDIEATFLKEAGLKYAEYLELLIDQRNYLTNHPSRGTVIPMSQIFNEVHDSIVVDVFPDHAKRDQEIVIESMRAVRSLRDLTPGFNHKILNADWKLSSHWRSK